MKEKQMTPEILFSIIKLDETLYLYQLEANDDNFAYGIKVSDLITRPNALETYVFILNEKYLPVYVEPTFDSLITVEGLFTNFSE
jgi:hypothetical protein